MSDDNLKSEIELLKSEISDLKKISGTLDSLVKKVDTIASSVIAPRAVSLGDGHILAKTQFDNLFLIVESSDRLIGPHLIMTGVYEKGLTAYFRNIVKEKMTFVDIGANIGYYSCMFGRRLRDNGRLFAFEAEPKNFSLLQRNAQINWIDRSNIVLENLAVGDSAGELTLYRYENKPGNTTSIAPGAESNVAGEISEVTAICVTLNDYFENIDNNVDVMKIDVEGAELAVLRGATNIFESNEHIKLVLEWDPSRWAKANASAAEVRDFLEERSFFPTLIDSKGNTTPSNWEYISSIKYANILFTRRKR